MPLIARKVGTETLFKALFCNMFVNTETKTPKNAYTSQIIKKKYIIYLLNFLI